MNDDTRIRTESGAFANSEGFGVDVQPDPELELVIQCTRAAGSAASVERVRALASDANGDVDWDRVLALAHRHQMTPLVYDRLHSICFDAVAEPVQDVLRDRYRANAIRNRYVVSELCAIHNARSFSVLTRGASRYITKRKTANDPIDSEATATVV